SSRNSARRVFLLYRSKPVIIASVLCFILCIPPVLLALYPELLWKAETLIRVSLGFRLRCRLLFFLRTHQAEFLHLIAQGVTADVEELGGMGLVAVGLAQGHLHQRALHLLKRRAAVGDGEPRQAAAVG